MEIVQTMNSDPGLAVGEALIFVLLKSYCAFHSAPSKIISDTA